MGRPPYWTREKIIKAYINACEKAGCAIGLHKFKKNKELPRPETVYKYFDSTYELKYLSGFIEKEKYLEMSKKKSDEVYTFCQDCVDDPGDCGNDVNECIVAGELYLKGAN